MAATPRIKIDRKALRDPDEFHLLGARATAWAAANRQLLYAVAGTVAAVLLVALALSWYRDRQVAAAGVRFSLAHGEFAAGRLEEATTSFEALHRDYGGTPFGQLALLYRGHALSRRGDHAGAVAAYEAYLAARVPADYLRQQALLGLGEASLASGDLARAREALGQAADIAGPFRTPARLALARLAESGGDSEKARELYAAVLSETPAGTPLREFLEGRVEGASASRP